MRRLAGDFAGEAAPWLSVTACVAAPLGRSTNHKRAHRIYQEEARSVQLKCDPNISCFRSGFACGNSRSRRCEDDVTDERKSAGNHKGHTPDLAAMQADIAHLKEVVPSQSHAMTDVGYQFANLWFAGKHKNWPLAEFFLNESRQHIVWTIRIRPVRKNPDGGSIDIRALFEGIQDGALKGLTQSIANKNEAAFISSYKNMLEACYSCHRAAAEAFLRPMVPTSPPQFIINFDPVRSGPSEARVLAKEALKLNESLLPASPGSSNPLLDLPRC
jgi:hypothetical protein